jgi:Leucine-rich repeat (LRR) protein
VRNRIIILFCLLAPFCLNAQNKLLPIEAFDTVYTFTNIDSALVNKDKVIKLDLSKQKLDSFPKEIFLLPNLQYLDLKKNRISFVPNEISELKKLQYLNLSKNRLDSLPESIGNLTHLKVLSVSQNYLVKLPESIGNLKQLEVLDLWSNDLRFFPESMKELKMLKMVDLRVINLSPNEKEYLKRLLPETTKIYFSNGCSCGF